MTVLPVLDRELRAQSRLALTYWLRVLGAGAVLFAAAVFGSDHGFGTSVGAQLFGSLHATLFCAIWVLVPQFTADCISREKREGTLGLLFLTPLRAGDIVLAKGLVHGLRGLTLWLAVLPVLTIPILLGGVTWREAVLSAVVCFSCICWALAAGILASSAGRAWSRSLLLACLLGFCLCLIFIYVNGLCFFWLVAKHLGGRAGLGQFPPSSAVILLAGLYSATDFEGGWRQLMAMIPPSHQDLPLLSQGIAAGLSVLFLLGTIAVSARSLGRSWQDRPAAAWQLRFERAMTTPVLGVSFFRRWLRHKLERNPIGWLEQRTWSGRLTSWGWFAVTISLFSLALTDINGRAFQAMQKLTSWLVIVSLAMSAAGSFRRERETGLLELLLVAPLTERQIIIGRLRGLWGQFLPALLVLIVVWMYLDNILPTSEDNAGELQFCVVSYFVLPVIGLYYSLRRSNFMVSLLSTLFMGLFLPMGVLAAFRVGTSALGGDPGQGLVTLVQLGVGAMFAHRLYNDLKRRNFSFDRSVA